MSFPNFGRATHIFNIVIVLAATVVGLAQASAAQIIYVNQAVAPTAVQNGNSWATAYRELRDAFHSPSFNPTAANPVEFWVAKGTYLPTSSNSTNRMASFVLSSHVRILGGFQGNETSDTQRLFFGHPTVLSGDIGIPQTNAITASNAEIGHDPANPADPGLLDNCYNVIRGDGVTGVVLDKLIITGGCAVSNGVAGDYINGMTLPADSDANDGSAITALDSVVAGGGVFFRNVHDRPTNQMDLIINNCTFVNNIAVAFGAGLAVREAKITVAYTTFVGNHAGYNGGGFFGQNSYFDFAYCNFYTNRTSGSGAAMEVQTFSSDQTLPKVDDPIKFEEVYHMTPKEFRRYTGFAVAGATLVPKLVGNIHKAYSATSGLLAAVKNGARETLPANPFAKATANKDRIASVYAALSFCVAATDIGLAIADASGANLDENDPDLKRWRIFSAGFNKWATPEGYAATLAGLLADALGKLHDDSQGRLYKTALGVKTWQLQAYNQAPYSSVIYCNFENNQASGQGGAVNLVHDNVQFESCRFSRNLANDTAGAMALSAWTTPKIFSCIFYQNVSFAGDSAISNYEHARSQIINCTLYQNYCLQSTNGYAINNGKGAEVKIYNSILWGNTNLDPTNALGGADIFTSTKATLSSDTNALQNYNDAEGGFGDWIGICDIANSCVQSLNRLPLGTDHIVLFPKLTYTPAESDKVLKEYATGEANGTLESFGFVNTGEGNRPLFLDASRGNISSDPLLNSDLSPGISSPVIDAGSKNRFNNGINNTVTGVDALRNDRFTGGSVDMGAVERQDGFARGEIVYVKPVATGNGSGSSWANAKSDLQGAINGAAPHQVWVAAGTYKPTSGTDRDARFSLVSGVAVYGGFNGTETNLTQQNWIANPTIISGDIGVQGNNSDNSRFLFYNSNVDRLALLDGFTLTKGGDYDSGSAMFNLNSSPTIRNCKFIENVGFYGGAISTSGGTEGSELFNCQFISNSAQRDGGALFYTTRLRADRCTFIRNTARTGGAIVINTTDYAYIYNSLFVSNSIVGGTEGFGGAIESSDVSLNLFNSTFYRNSAVVGAGSNRGGGAVEFISSTETLQIQNCIFWNNTATNTAGSTASIERRQISMTPGARNFITDNIIEAVNELAGRTDDGNVDVDPNFANPAGGDFRLSASSPAIDAGQDKTGYGYPAKDLDNNVRVANDTMDLGAYEFQGTPAKFAFRVSVTKICDESGGIHSVQLVGTNPPSISYQWEVNKNDGLGFVAISNSAIYQGATTTNLAIVHPPISFNGYRYRVHATGQGINFTSSAGTVSVSRSVLYVKANATGANNGTTWLDAFTSLQSAMQAAAPCSQIWVAAGTYYPGSTTNAFLRMKSDLQIFGGFSGTETNLSQRNWKTNVTTLSGNIGAGIKSANIFYNNGNQTGFACGPSAVLDGFTLTDAAGGAMINDNASPTVRNCTFSDNAGSFGGAMANSYNSSPLISNCIFTRNSSGQGGAINNSQSSPVIVNSIFHANRGNHRGGAMANFSSYVQVLNCTFYANKSGSVGGGIYQQGGTNLIRNSILWQNRDGNLATSLASEQAFQESSGQLSIENSCVQGTTNGINLPYEPLFVNTGAADFRLSPLSPLLNVGNNLFTNGIPTDAAGNPRVFGAAVDLGAYELQSAGSNTLSLLAAPQSVAICDISMPQSFTVTGTNDNPGSYQWEVNSGSGFVPAVGANYSVTTNGTSSTLTVSGISNAMNGWQFRAVITVSAATPPATLTISTPTIIRVNVTALGANNGTSWNDAYTDLKTALNAADTCTEIWVAKGNYVPTSAYDGLYSFRMKAGVGIYGGFFGNESTRSQRNWTNNVSLLSASTNGSSVFYNNSDYGIEIDASAVLDGFTLTGSTTINNFYSSPTIRNCTFTNNNLAIYNRNSTATIVNCVFSNNFSSAVYNYNGSPGISNCLFVGNHTENGGAAIYSRNANSTIDNCVFRQNTAGSGGAINNDGNSSAVVTRCIFENNSSGNGGGFLGSVGSSAVLKNCLFDNNTSPKFHGGAISHYGNELTLINCTVANNSGALSGGLYNQGSNVQIKNSIFWGNFLTGGYPEPNLEKVQINNFSSVTAQVFNSTVQGWTNFDNGNIAYDPLFTNALGKNFQLNNYSPALNAGSNADVDANATDVAGNSRIFDATVDMGAYELQASSVGPLRFLTAPNSVATCLSNTALYSIVGAPADNYVFRWQQFDGTNFVDVTAGGDTHIIPGTNSSMLIFSNLTLANGGIFRMAISNTAYVSPQFSLTVSPPQIIYVNDDSPMDGFGNAWTNAFRKLQDAINAADACSEIWVASGTYLSSNSVSMKNGLRIYGGFAGVETLRTQRNWTNNVTTLQSTTAAAIFYNNGYHGLISGSALLDGFKITGSSDQAIYNFAASPTFQNCTFANNSGTAIFNDLKANPVFLNCLFTNNADTAIWNMRGCSVLVGNCVFTGNHSDYSGGAIENVSSALQLIDSVFINNGNIADGGAVSVSGSSLLTATRCRFSGNTASDGGAVSVVSASAALADCLFTDNSATLRGGAMSVLGANVAVNNCTLTRNIAGIEGGGIDQALGTLGTTNSIFWLNTAGLSYITIEKAQIANYEGVQNVANCTVQGLNTFTGNNNSPYDPLFANSVTGNFSLNLLSPAINAGNNSATSQSGTDLAGNPRVFATNVDLGAYEVQVPTNSAPVRLLTTPQSQTICEGNFAIFPVVGASNDSLSVTWQLDSGSGFANVTNDSQHIISSNSNSSTLIVSNTITSMSGRQYRFNIGNGLYFSVPVTLTVTPRGVIFVNAASANPTQSGASWASAFTNLQSAIAVADKCSEIWVAQGTYVPTYYLGLNSYAMKPGLQLYGGFAGTETMRAQRNWTNNQTILFGNGQGAVVYNSGSPIPMDATAVLDGFTITSTNSQAGVHNYFASPTIRNCRFENCVGTALSGVISSVVLDSCTFVSNRTTSVELRSGGTATINNCTFSNNTTVLGNVQILMGASAVISNSRFLNNTDTHFGAGIRVFDQATVSAINCVFSGNTAPQAPSLYLADANGSLINCLFVNNHASQRAGAIFTVRSQLQIANTTISQNSAANAGGGLESYDSTNTILNSILWNNIDGDPTPTLTSAQIHTTGGTLTLSNSCVQGTAAASGNFSYDPLFVDSAAGNFHLSENSPANNTGNNSFIAGTATDLDGTTRIQLTNVDLGPYESSVTVAPFYFSGTPGSQVVCPGEVATFTLATTNGIAGLGWLYNTGEGWGFFSVNSNQLSGPAFGTYFLSNTVDSISLIVSNTTVAMNGYRFRLTSSGGGFAAAPVSLFVNSNATIYVNAAAPFGGNGTTWATAYNSLQTALANANPCRPNIWVAKGTYLPTSTTDQNAKFNLVPGTAIYGGFFGNETNLNQRNLISNPTILSGDIGVPGDASDNSLEIVSGWGVPVAMEANTILDGVVVENGGVGITLFLSSPTIQNCTVRSNSNSGFNLNSASPLIQNCSVLWNRGSNGGGLRSAVGNPRVQNCIFSGNTATNGGGGLYFQEGNAVVANSLITGNTCGALGAGICHVSTPGSLNITNCTISGNAAGLDAAGGVYGGAVASSIRNSILWGNSSTGNSLQKSQFDFNGGSSNIIYSCVQGASPQLAAFFNKTNDPLFVAEIAASAAPFSGGNYRLQGCSPSVNAGDSFYNPGSGVDLDGASRFVGMIDIGSYELQSAAETPLIISSHPLSVPYCASGLTAFNASATGSGLTYQWQVNFNNGGGFVSLISDAVFSGTTTPSLTISNAPLTLDKSQYRCVVSSAAGCSAFSQAATLTIKPARLYVNGSAPGGGNGLSWDTAYQKLEDALHSPSLDLCGAEIWVAAGTYRPPPSATGFGNYYSMTNHVAIYGGFVGGETALYLRNWKTNPTILQGTIDGGPGIGFYVIYNEPITVPISNSARLDGFIIQDSVYGVYNQIGFQTPGASPTIANCVFRQTRTAIENRSDSSTGNSTPIIQDCLFVNNGAASGVSVAGIANRRSSALIERCEFRGNLGGALINCGNVSPAKIYDCLISGNNLGVNSAIFVEGNSAPDFRNCTIVGNKSSTEPAGLAAGNATNIYNCIIWGNEGQSGPSLQAQYSAPFGAPIVSHCDIQGWPGSANGNIALDPLFVQAINASSAPTTNGDFHLGTCSPAINTGDNSLVAGDPFDLEINPRIVSATVDMGAYEAEASLLFFTLQPGDQTGTITNSVQFVAAASAFATFQWEINNGGGFVALTNDANYSGATTTTLTATNLTAAMDNYLYRCRAETPSECAAYSQVATLHYINGAPVVLGIPSLGIKEGTTVVSTYTATDPELDSVTWSVGGIDATNFQISVSGALSFISPPDYEAPTDTDTNNFYELLVFASDPFGNSNSLSVVVAVTNDTTEPFFLTTPMTNAFVGTPYSYSFAAGPNQDVLTFSAPTLPAWLTFVTNTFVVSTYAGNGSAGSADGTGTGAAFSNPTDIALDSTGNLVVSDFNNKIRQVAPGGIVSTLPIAAGAPVGIGLDAGGNIYFSDLLFDQIRKAPPGGGTITNILTISPSPENVAPHANGAIYFTRLGQHSILSIVEGGSFNFLAGFSSGFVDGTGFSAQFSSPRGIAIDADGILYVADTGNHAIRRITTNGVVTTIAGNGLPGSANGTGTNATFNSPRDVAVDGSGNLYVADSGNNRIRKITPAGVVTTLAGTGSSGFDNGAAAAATFNNPQGIAVNGAGTIIYVSESGNYAIRKLEFLPPTIFGTPTSGELGNHPVLLQVTDGTNTASQPFVINVVPANIPPVATSQTLSLNEDTTLAITLTASDADGGTLTYFVSANPTNGTLTGTVPNLIYHPTTNFNGPDSFKFYVNDGQTNSALATISITVDPVNDAPVASNQLATVFKDRSGAITLTGSDVENSTLSFIVVTNPAHGSLSGTLPNLIYTATNHYVGADSFAFKVNDGNLDSLLNGIVSITVLPTNTPPVAIGQSLTNAEDTQLLITLSGTDADDDVLSYAVIDLPTNGTLSGTPPNMTYLPATNFAGNDSFTFRANDGQSNSAPATISITVTPVNDAPVADPQSLTTYDSAPLNITFTGSDVENSNLTFSVVSGPLHGVLSGLPPTVTYTATNNYLGTDSFTFKANDGDLDSASATISILVQPVALIVTTIADSGPDTLRAAIDQANTDTNQLWTIQFSTTLAGQTISLSTIGDSAFGWSAFVINGKVVLDGANAPGLIVAREFSGPPMRLLRVAPGAELTISNLIFTGGVALGGHGFEGRGGGGGGAGLGGAILNEGTLTIDTAKFQQNEARGGNGGNGSTSIIVGGNGGGPNGGLGGTDETGSGGSDGPGSPGGFGGGGGGAAYANGFGPSGGAGYGAGIGGGSTGAGNPGGTGGFGGGGGGGSGGAGGGGIGAGGAIFNRGGIVLVRNSEFTFNNVSGGSGGIGNFPPVPSLNGSSASGFGSGIFNLNGAVTILNSGFTNGGTSIFNLGDSTNSAVRLEQVTLADFGGLTDFAQDTINGGFADAVGNSNITLRANYPQIEDIADRTTVGPFAFDFFAIANNPYLITGTSDNQALIPNANLVGSGSGTDTNATLTVRPVISETGTVEVIARVVDGNISVGDIFKVTVTHNLFATVRGNETVIVPILANGFGWYVNGTGQGNYGSMTFTPTSLTYSNTIAPVAGVYSDVIGFDISDGQGGFAVGYLTVQVSPTNNPPVANGQVVSTDEDTPLPVLLSGSDSDSDNFTMILVNGPTNGTLSGTIPNLTYSPFTNFHGSDSFTFKANDGRIDSLPGTISITVMPVNDQPVATNQTVFTPLNTSVPVTLGASDIDGDSLNYFHSTPANGILSGSSSNLTYTPDTNFFGTNTFTFYVNDDATNSDTATVTIVVNNPPTVALNTGATVNEGSTNTIANTMLLLADEQPASQLTFTLNTPPALGTLKHNGAILNAGGAFTQQDINDSLLTYTHDGSETASDSFAFVISDGSGGSNGPSTFNITVTPVNDPPFLAGSSEVLYAVDGANANPNANLYILNATDGSVQSVIGPVGYPITGIAIHPTTGKMYGSVVDNAPSGAASLVEINPATGVATMIGSFGVAMPGLFGPIPQTMFDLTFTPDGVLYGWSGPALSVGFSIDLTTGVATEINPFLLSPFGTFGHGLASDQNGELFFAGYGTAGPLQTVSRVEGTRTTVATLSDPPSGFSVNAMAFNAAGVLYGIENRNPISGLLTINTNTGAITRLGATPNNMDAIAFGAGGAGIPDLTTNEGAPPIGIVLTNHFDDAEDGASALTHSIVTNDNQTLVHATLTNGILRLELQLHENGVAHLTIRAQDSGGLFVESSFAVTVTPVNDAPFANNIHVLVSKGVAKNITLTGFDPEGASLAFTLQGTPEHGVLTGTEPDLLYTPASGYSGPDSFSFTVSDGILDSTSGVVQIQVLEPGTLTLPTTANGNVTFQVAGVPGNIYEIQYTSDLNILNWIPLGTTTVGANGFAEFSEAVSFGQRFYRAILQ